MIITKNKKSCKNQYIVEHDLNFGIKVIKITTKRSDLDKNCYLISPNHLKSLLYQDPQQDLGSKQGSYRIGPIYGQFIHFWQNLVFSAFFPSTLYVQANEIYILFHSVQNARILWSGACTIHDVCMLFYYSQVFLIMNYVINLPKFKQVAEYKSLMASFTVINFIMQHSIEFSNKKYGQRR